MLITRCNTILHSDKYYPSSLLLPDTLFVPLCLPLCLILDQLLDKYLQASLLSLTQDSLYLSTRIIFSSFEPKVYF